MLIKTMGLLLFAVGLVLIILTTLVIFDLVHALGIFERWLVFASGIILCVISYLMARTEEELTVESKELEEGQPTHLNDASHHAS